MIALAVVGVVCALSLLVMLVIVIRAKYTVNDEDEIIAAMSDEEIIEHNEKWLYEYRHARHAHDSHGEMEAIDELIEHPTIGCRFNDLAERMGDQATMGAVMHGNNRRAIWRRDMTYPECRNCVVEDPLE